MSTYGLAWRGTTAMRSGETPPSMSCRTRRATSSTSRSTSGAAMRSNRSNRSSATSGGVAVENRRVAGVWGSGTRSTLDTRSSPSSTASAAKMITRSSAGDWSRARSRDLQPPRTSWSPKMRISRRPPSLGASARGSSRSACAQSTSESRPSRRPKRSMLSRYARYARASSASRSRSKAPRAPSPANAASYASAVTPSDARSPKRRSTQWLKSSSRRTDPKTLPADDRSDDDSSAARSKSSSGLRAVAPSHSGNS